MLLHRTQISLQVCRLSLLYCAGNEQCLSDMDVNSNRLTVVQFLQQNSSHSERVTTFYLFENN